MLFWWPCLYMWLGLSLSFQSPLFCTFSVLNVILCGEFLFWSFLFSVLYASCILIGIWVLRFGDIFFYDFLKNIFCGFGFLLLLYLWFVGLVFLNVSQSSCGFCWFYFWFNTFFDWVIQSCTYLQFLTSSLPTDPYCWWIFPLSF